MTLKITDRWNGFTNEYDLYRPRVPDRLIEILLNFADNRQPELVIDLGSGTGNSSRTWQGRAKRITGIEPSEQMIARARELTPAGNINYVHAFAGDTGLPPGCADYVVASSSIHWMQPDTTLREVKRLLNPKGIFAFWGVSHPPVTPFIALDQAFFELMKKIDQKEWTFYKPQNWTWAQLLEEAEKNNHFGLHRFFHIDQGFTWNRDDYINWFNTTIPEFFRCQMPEFNEVYEEFISKIKHHFGHGGHPVFFVYSVHVFKS